MIRTAHHGGSKEFSLSVPLQQGGELIINGNCWECEPLSPDGYACEPYGYEVRQVQYKPAGKLPADVTGLYEYLYAQTRDGAENFEHAIVQHVAYIYQRQPPYWTK